jgi:signal-transduction protein with cAMP-binding, CBS, and nucleotidyltransferase domain
MMFLINGNIIAIHIVYSPLNGRLGEVAIRQLTTYLIENIPYFNDYPMKAVEELASRLEQRIYNYKEVIAKEGQQINEMLIIYQGEAALVEGTDYHNSKSIFTENYIIGEKQEKGSIIAQSARVKVLVLHKMFLKDTVFVSFVLIINKLSMCGN